MFCFDYYKKNPRDSDLRKTDTSLECNFIFFLLIERIFLTVYSDHGPPLP